MPLPIIFEDADLLVVDKPAGLVTHPAPGHWTGTLVNAVLWHLQQQLPDVEHPPLHATMRPGIVHRLDKETSGLLIVAKTEDAHFALAKQLKARTIHRRYLTCVHGIVDCDEGTVNVPVGRHTTDRKKMVVHDDEALGRPAVTRYRVRQRVERPDPALQVGPYTVLECWLETGRTHQVRVHMTHLGHPVIGDPTYGRRGRSNAPRHLLHARELTFQHPRTGEAMTLTAPIPADMAPYVENRTGSIF